MEEEEEEKEEGEEEGIREEGWGLELSGLLNHSIKMVAAKLFLAG